MKFSKSLKSIAIVSFIVLFNVASISNASAISATDLVGLTNNSRSQLGLNALTINQKLISAARAKANDMFANNYFNHVSPTGKTPWDFITAAGYSYSYAGENLAIGYTDNSELHNDWMNSPTHRDNIINASYREIGIAAVEGTYDGTPTIIVVQMFGAPEENTDTNTPAVNSVTSEPSPEPTTESSPAVETSENEIIPEASPQKSFDIIKEKTGFSPAKIFAGDEVTFTVTLTGEIKNVQIKVGDKKINLENTSSSSEKIYVKKVRLNQVGDLPVNLSVDGTTSINELLSLGNLTVAPRVIAKNSDSDTFIKGVSGFVSDNSLTLAVSTLVLLTLVAGIYVWFKKNPKLVFKL